MLQDGEALLIDMDTLSYGNPILEFAIIDFTYNTFSLYEENNSKQFLGIDKDTAFKFYDLVTKYYFEGKDKNVIERNQKRIEFLCSLRIINHVYKRSKDMNILNKVGENIKSLLNEINDLNLE